MHVRKQEGFTLIELLIVIALIAVLAGAVIIALNPARQFQLARNSERWSHVSAIVGAVTSNITENKGVWDGTLCGAATLPTTITAMSSAVAAGNICGCVSPSQMATFPVDPSTGSFTSCTTYASGYSIVQDPTSGRVTVSASAEAGAPAISVTQ